MTTQKPKTTQSVSYLPPCSGETSVVAGFSPRSAFAKQHCARQRTRAKARDYTRTAPTVVSISLLRSTTLYKMCGTPNVTSKAYVDLEALMKKYKFKAKIEAGNRGGAYAEARREDAWIRSRGRTPEFPNSIMRNWSAHLHVFALH